MYVGTQASKESLSRTRSSNFTRTFQPTMKLDGEAEFQKTLESLKKIRKPESEKNRQITLPSFFNTLSKFPQQQPASLSKTSSQNLYKQNKITSTNRLLISKLIFNNEENSHNLNCKYLKLSKQRLESLSTHPDAHGLDSTRTSLLHNERGKAALSERQTKGDFFPTLSKFPEIGTSSQKQQDSSSSHRILLGAQTSRPKRTQDYVISEPYTKNLGILTQGRKPQSQTSGREISSRTRITFFNPKQITEATRLTERSKDTNHGSRGNHLDVLTTHETVHQNDFNHPSADFQYKMEENFNSQFKKEKLTANTNDSEIVRYQEIGKQKITYLRDAPQNKLTMKLRAKRSKLAIQDPIRFEPVSKENTMLVISLSPLSFLKNDKLSYSFIEREFYKSGMPKDQVRAIFQQFMEDLRRTMGLSKKYCFLYTRDGLECHDIYDVARNEKTLFISCLQNFGGVRQELKKIDRRAQARFLKDLERLEKNVNQETAVGIELATIEEKIREKYQGAQTELIDFIHMSRKTCNSEQLGKLYQDVANNKVPISQISQQVGKVTEDFNFVCEQVIEKSAQPDSGSNCVITFLKRTYPGFFKQNFQIETSEISEADLCTDKEKKALEEKKKLVCKMLIEELNSSLEEEQKKLLIQNMRELYITASEPVIQSHNYQVLCLLLKYYKIDVKWGFDDQNLTLMEEIVMKLAKLNGIDPRKKKQGRAQLRKQIETFLEKILKRNHYKLADVVIDLDLNTLGGPQSSEEEDEKKVENGKDNSPKKENSGSAEVDLDKAKSGSSDEEDELQDEEDEANEESYEINLGKKEDESINYIEKNKIAVMDKKSILKTINDCNKELASQNIPYLSNSTNFTRTELHQFYIMYKALCHCTSQRYGIMEYDVKDGIDKHCFQKGIFQVSIQSQELADRIFNTIDDNYSGFMDWPEFINGMKIIKAKTLKDKIDLFIKMADENDDGQLSWNEINHLCKNNLAKYIGERDSEFLESMSEYFTKLIFKCFETELDDEIPMHDIRDYILKIRWRLRNDKGQRQTSWEAKLRIMSELKLN